MSVCLFVPKDLANRWTNRLLLNRVASYVPGRFINILEEGTTSTTLQRNNASRKKINYPPPPPKKKKNILLTKIIFFSFYLIHFLLRQLNTCSITHSVCLSINCYFCNGNCFHVQILLVAKLLYKRNVRIKRLGETWFSLIFLKSEAFL